MISVFEAKKKIEQSVVALDILNVALQDAANLRLAQDIYASSDIPAFPQSSMDGYAFAFNDWKHEKQLKITGIIAAGSEHVLQHDQGTAVRIFTGAAVPHGADTVVMQEKVHIEDGKLKILDDKILQGNSVRPKGSEIKAGELALSKNMILSPGAIGFLAGIGTSHVKVFPNPKISIIITGNELIQPGNSLNYGQVYDSNSFTLQTVLRQSRIKETEVYYATDNPEIVTDTLALALEKSDVVLFTGGVSVGDYDFVLQACRECGVEEVFHKIKQRPGKPLYFGKKGNKLVFGLPGNPSSVLTCYYQYVLIALGKLSNREISLKKIEAPLTGNFRKNTGLTHFLKGIYDGNTVKILDAQESYRMKSFAVANCIIEIDEHTNSCEEGEPVTVYLLPV